MFILYIYSTCWRMKSVFYKRQQPILLVPSWPLYGVDRMIRLPLLIVPLGRARLVRVARLLLLLLLSSIEGHLHS
jgi:hypothetical protein